MYQALVPLIVTVLANFHGDCLAEEPPGGYYRSRYDHIDVETVVNSKRLVHYYGACLLGRGPCPPQGAELRRILPEALQTNCARCTEKQKAGAFRTIKRLQKEYPSIWKELVEEYDPTEKYVRRFEETMLRKKPYLPSGFPNTIRAATNEVQNLSPAPTSITSVTDTASIITSTSAPSNKIATVTNTVTSSTTYTTKQSITNNPSTTASSPAKTTSRSAGGQSTVKTDIRDTSTVNIFEPLPLFVPPTFSDGESSKKVTTNTETELYRLGLELGRLSFQLCKLLLGANSEFCDAKHNIRQRRTSARGTSGCSFAYH